MVHLACLELNTTPDENHSVENLIQSLLPINRKTRLEKLTD